MVSRRILLIGSDERAAELTRATLEDEGYDVLEATDGAGGLLAVRREEPDLVIVDIDVSGMSGTEVCRRLRKDSATDHVKLLMVAEESRVEKLVIGRGASADDYLIKPFDPQELITKIVPLLSQDEGALVVSTGNTELDDKMGGGIPMGSLTLIEGDSGAGKSVLAQQIIYGALDDGYRLSLFTSENTIKSLVKQMRSLSLDILDYLLLDRIRVFPITTSRLGHDAPRMLADAIRREENRDVIYVDSLTSSIPESSEKEVLAFFEECKEICSDGTTVVLVVHSHGLNSELLVRIRSLCDAHFQLCTQEVGQRLVKTLEATKVRGAEKTTGNIISFEVEPGWGMRVIPLNKVRG